MLQQLHVNLPRWPSHHQMHSPIFPISEAINIPRSVLSGDHPSQCHFQSVVQCHFFAFNMTDAINHMTLFCHMCASLQKIPSSPITLSLSEDPPEVVGISFATNIIKHSRQLILVH